MNDLDARWRDVCNRHWTLGRETLSGPERVWVDVRMLIDSIENGGLISYFYNSGADDLASCRDALIEIDASDVLLLVDRVADLFGDPVPRTVDARNQLMASWPETGPHDVLLTAVDDTLMPMMPLLERRLRHFLCSVGLCERE